MTRKILAVVAAFASMAGAAARADDLDEIPGPGWISMAQATQKLHDLGYSTVVELKSDDGYWKAKAMKGTVTYKVRLEPRLGTLVSQRPEGQD